MSTKDVTKFISEHTQSCDSRDVCTDDGWTRLKTLLGKVEKGQPEVYTAPFAGRTPMAKVLQEWNTTLVSVSEQWPTLYDYEVDLASKVGPLSVQLPLKERLDDLRHYYEDILLPQAPIDSRAIKAVMKEFASVGGMHLRSNRATYDKMKKSTSAGLPTMGKRKVNMFNQMNAIIKHDDDSIDLTVSIVRNNKPKTYNSAAVLGWRGQEGGPQEDDVKQRVIWMFPCAINLQELRVYQPLIEACQKHDLVPAWVSMDDVDAHITQLFDTKGQDDLIVCTDFSKFDQHFNSTMQDAAKTILANILHSDAQAAYWLEDIFPLKYMIPLVYKVGDDKSYNDYVDMLVGKHGMASGSGGTNADETLAHRALQYEAAIHANSRLNPHSMCLGDDGILTYPGITVDQVVDVYESHGQECNVSKQYASSQDCTFLRRWHHKDYRIDGMCRGVYSTNRALGKLRYLERFMDPDFWSSEMVALRQLSIIENCKWHPLFHEFIDFCMKRDKYRLGIDLPGFLDNLTEIAKEAIDHMQDFLGYTKTLQGEGPDGIANWEVVKYLKSKA